MYQKLIEKEYLVTNGIGGFSSSSITGANTRKYHSILNASLNPPVNRTILLSKLITHIKSEQDSFTLESAEYENTIEDNTSVLKDYNYYPIPSFVYYKNGISIKKEIAMQHGENTVAVHYTISTGKTAVEVDVDVLVNSRDHHDLSDRDSFSYNITNKGCQIHLENKLTNFYVNGFGEFHPCKEWVMPEFYRVEERRGQGAVDRNLKIGVFKTKIKANTTVSFGVVASIKEKVSTSEQIIKDELHRIEHLTTDQEILSKKLHLACDQFIVDRISTQSKTVIAGYPWFTDWGRDTMIALPGLTLSTKRFHDAKDIIRTFIKYEKDGLIPNMFPDDNIEPMYNTIDGTLWLFVAVYQYYKSSKDLAFINEIFPTLLKVINHHINGTLYNIGVDEDYLLSGGDASTQLTWMDVKIDGHVVTPRHGKAVEINALWYNALMIMNYLEKVVDTNTSINFVDLATQCQKSFNEKFWHDSDHGLYDLIQEGQPIKRIRPNQIFAVSLPFMIVTEVQAKSIIKVIENKLLTPFGLRSLSQDHSDYTPVYNGDVYKRDYAYHQGTVWGWLLGPYLEAHYKIYKDKFYIREKMKGLIHHLDETGLGTISEVFSGDEPHHARGCFGQAWSVSELLRIYKLIED